MTSKPREAEFYEPLRVGALADGWLVFRISDGSFGKKCFDLAGAAQDGLACGIEVKVVNKFPTNEHDFPWQLFASHQIIWLNSYMKQGSYALCPLFEWKTDTMRVYLITETPPYTYAVLTQMKGGAYVGWNSLLK